MSNKETFASAKHSPFESLEAINGLLDSLTPGRLVKRLSGTICVHEACFASLWYVIGLVSSIDAYLTIKYQDSIGLLEVNPVGQWLLWIDGGDPSLFIGAKFLGTIIVLSVLWSVYRFNKNRGLTLAGMLGLFQIGLLCYLSFA
jgi:hypothetical protein